MRSNRRIIFAGITVAILAFAAWQAFKTREPSYHGKTLTEWCEIAESNSVLFVTLDEAPINAIHHIGTNGIPLLLKFAESTDTPFRIKLCGCVNWLNRKQGFIHLRMHSSEEMHSFALRGFLTLQSEAQPAVPGLIKLLRNPDPEVCKTAFSSLIFMGPVAKPAFPAMRRLLNDPDETIRVLAMSTIDTTTPNKATNTETK